MAARSPILVLLLTAGACAAADAVSGSQTPVRAAALARQNAVKTLEAEYHVTEFVAKGAVSSLPIPGPAAKTGAIPAKAQTIKSTNRIVISGSKVRCEVNHPIFSAKGDLDPQQLVGVSNGKVAKKFFPAGTVVGKGPPTGVIDKGAMQSATRSYMLVPLLVALRGDDTLLCPYPASRLKPTGVTLPVHGVSCEEYTADDMSFWVDPKAGYVPRRISRRVRGRLLDQWDVTYRPDDTCGWVPVSWTRNWYSQSGAVLSSAKVDVITMRINDAQPEAQFEVDFPPGTVVHDNTSIGEYYKPRRVQGDGSLRDINPVTLVDYPDARTLYEKHRWLIISFGVFALASGALYVVRRRRRAAPG